MTQHPIQSHTLVEIHDDPRLSDSYIEYHALVLKDRKGSVCHYSSRTLLFYCFGVAETTTIKYLMITLKRLRVERILRCGRACSIGNVLCVAYLSQT